MTGCFEDVDVPKNAVKLCKLGQPACPMGLVCRGLNSGTELMPCQPPL
jgi:hypothetical protein